MKGTRLIKDFPQYGWYEGTIKEINGESCRVVYSDGDEEDIVGLEKAWEHADSDVSESAC